MLVIFRLWVCLFYFLLAGCQPSQPELISLFPIEHYNQNVTTWINPASPSYDKPLIPTKILIHKKTILLKHYFGSASPWNEAHVKTILNISSPDDIAANEKEVIHTFSNLNKSFEELQWGENFRKHDQPWLKSIRENINIRLLSHLTYASENRAIAIDNLNARALPTDDVSFHDHTLGGQGYPFDNLQMSSIWIGTPLYILAETKDKAWSLVMTPDFITWVKTNGIARVSDSFVKKWSRAAIQQLIAITKTKTSLMTENLYRGTTYIGTLLPGKNSKQGFQVLVPVTDLKGHAVIQQAILSKKVATTVPLSATPHHFSNLMQSLLGRPYGWGNLYFYNDCSAELKNLFAAFGIWLPRHSADQIYAGKPIELSNYSPKQRRNYLMKYGKPLTTLIYIDGHIILFLGNYPNPNSRAHETIPMTYQNMWGLHPVGGGGRKVVGQAVIFPLLERFPEDSSLASQLSRPHFRLSYLDEDVSHWKSELVSLKKYMAP